MSDASATSWQSIKFKNFITLQRGFDLPKSQREEGDYPVVASTSINGFHSSYKVEPPCVVTGRSGALGKVQYITNPCWPLNTTLWVKDFQGNDPHFVYYFLGTLGLEQYNAGAGVPTLNRNHLNELDISVPTPETQVQISSTLSTFDDLIENNTKRIKILEEMARLIYREWFVYFRYPDHEKVKMVDSGTELGDIPEGWEVKCFEDLASSIRRNVPKGDLAENTAYVGFEHIPRKCVALSEWEILNELGSTKLSFEENEILFGKIRPYFHKVVFSPMAGICSADIIVIQPNKPEYFPLALACASSSDFVNHATQSSKGTKMPRADWNVLCKYLVAFPNDDSVIESFNEQVTSMLQLIKKLSFANRKLAFVRDLLLPKLVSGQLDISSIALPSTANEK